MVRPLLAMSGPVPTCPWWAFKVKFDGGHAGGPESDNPNAPPYGVVFRLRLSFDETAFPASERVILRALKTHGMLLSNGGQIALTFANDRDSTST